MNAKAAQELFRRLKPAAQLRLLALFGHELTVHARDTYEVGTDQVVDAPRLRRINEIQHRVFGHINKLLDDDSERYPDDVLISIVLDHDDATLRGQLEAAFERASRAHPRCHLNSALATDVRGRNSRAFFNAAQRTLGGSHGPLGRDPRMR